MHTVSDWIIPVCIQGCTNPRMHMGISVHAIPVCIRGSPWSPFAYGDQDQSPYAYGVYLSCNPRSPYAYRDWSWSPYAYGDSMSCNPRMHTGVCAIHVCIWGSWRTQYAYGDSMTHNPCMHTGIVQSPYALCTRGLHDMLFLYAYGDWHIIPVIPEAERYPLNAKNIGMGSDIPEGEWGAISRNPQIISKWEVEQSQMQMWSDMISLNANGEQCKQYDALLMQY